MLSPSPPLSRVPPLLALFSSLLSPPLLPPFFFNHPPPTEIYTLSLHDALPISAISKNWPKSIPPCRTRRKSLPARWQGLDRKSTRLNSSHVAISYAVFCLKKKKSKTQRA